MSEPDPNPLEFVTLEQIKDELHKRYTGWLLVTETDLNGKQDKLDAHWGGGVFKAMGMAEWSKMWIYHRRPDMTEENK